MITAGENSPIQCSICREGWHSLTVKVWDVFNNSSEETIEFQVIAGENPVLSNVYNYPNPASDVTWFRFDHNKAGEELPCPLLCLIWQAGMWLYSGNCLCRRIQF